MTRISTLSQNQLILRNTQIIQERLQDLRRQISTGAKADQFGDLGSQSLGMTSALTRVAQAEQFLANNIQTKAKLDLREIAVRAIAEISMNLKAEFIQSEGIEDSRQLQQLAQNELERITSILNSRDQNGAYLFGGSRTNIAPVVKTVNGAAPPMFTFAFNNDLIVEQARIDNGVTIDIGVLAGANATTPDPAFAGLIETLNYFAAGRYPPPVPGTPVMPSPGVPVTTGAGSLVTAKIDAALAAVNDMNGDLGVKMKIIEQVNIRLREEIDLSIEFIGIVADADLAEILTRISQDQVSLEASYQVTGELRRLSLASFI